MTRTPVLKSEGASAREIAFVTNQVLLGRINSTGQVTLDANSATTLIKRPYIGTASVVLLMARTSSAAAEQPTIWITCVAGAATIQHSNSSQTDRLFNFAIIGG